MNRDEPLKAFLPVERVGNFPRKPVNEVWIVERPAALEWVRLGCEGLYAALVDTQATGDATRNGLLEADIRCNGDFGGHFGAAVSRQRDGVGHRDATRRDEPEEESGEDCREVEFMWCARGIGRRRLDGSDQRHPRRHGLPDYSSVCTVASHL
jgi:hypothetical protein